MSHFMMKCIALRRREAIKILTSPGKHQPTLITLAISFLKKWGVTA